MKGSGTRTSSRVPSILPGRPRRGNELSELIPLQTLRATRSAAEAFRARMYSTIPAKSTEASGDQRIFIGRLGLQDPLHLAAYFLVGYELALVQ